MRREAPMRRDPRAVPASGRRETRSGSSAALLGWCAVAALALLPAVVSLRAAWIAEDAAILGYVDRHGPLVDWTGSQYGLRFVPFWRPLVTSTWWVAERLFGVDPLGLRLANIAGHLAAVLLACAVARRAGTSVLAAFLAGALVASFPEVGGTVVWLAGRTDVLGAVGMLGALWCVLRGWNLGAAAATFAACATKEFGFLLPAWAGLVLWASGAERRAFVRGVLAVLAAALVAFAWRRLALGTFEGGYLLATRDTAVLVQDFPRALAHLATGLAPLGLGLVVLGVLGHLSGSLAPRLFAAGLATGALALVLVAPLARAGPLEPQNLRLLFVAEAGFALAGAGALARTARRPIVHACAVALALGLVGWRSGKGIADALEWKEASMVAEREVERVRHAVGAAAPSDRPVLAAGLPRAWRGAYCLDWGAAAYFRAPFEATPRPVWPDRAMFAVSGERPRAFAPRPDGTLWPFDDPPTVPVLALRDGEGGEPTRFEVDERSYLSEVDRSPRLLFEPPAEALGLEAAVYTELGSHVAPLGDARGGETSLMLLLSAADEPAHVAALGDALKQANDVGATRAFLELRLVGPQGELRAASPWVELVWDPELARGGP
jgi:hypothetical protein